MNTELHAWLSQIFQGLTLIKMAVAVVMVLGLSMLAERLSPRLAGLVSGYPLGAGITLFFIGLEISPAFAGQSATFMVLGLVATQFFVLGYWLISRQLSTHGGLRAAAASGVGGGIFYGAGAFLLQGTEADLTTAVLVTGLSMGFFTYLYRHISNVRITQPVPFSLRMVLLRAVFAAMVIVLTTSAAHVVGTGWAGVLAAFPVTLLPFLIILHTTYPTVHVLAVLKNVPQGLGSLVVYGVVVNLAYPVHGIWLGTLEGYLAATLWLLAVTFWWPRVKCTDGTPPKNKTV